MVYSDTKTSKKIKKYKINIMKKKLNIFQIPLKGIHLIEASAGTGKTSTIAFLYLRLLLGLEKNKENIRKLSVKEILVVTFTNAAKEELYIRIKKSIKELHLSCIKKKSKDPIFQSFLTKIKNFDEAIHILEDAKININNAAIYTIHGFCQDVLENNTLISNREIIENESFLYLQATQDFWRYFFYNLPKKIIKIIYEEYRSPEDLLREIKPILKVNSSINFKKKFDKKETLITFHEKIINKINIFKQKWLNYNLIILKIINQLKVNKKIYSNFNILKWKKKITEWAESETKNYKMPICLKYFSETSIEKNIKNYNFKKHIFFEEIDKILKKNFSLKNIILFYAIKNIPKFVKREKEKKLLLGFNDLLKILLKNIKKEESLREIIIKQYPVALIDEFQDTNIQQYQIFNTLYKNKKTALFLVGDPKQSIYSFRGADIFSYLHAKFKIKNYYYLDTNWRSSKNICKAINYLFSKNKNPFYFKNIPFEPILSSSKNLNMKFKIKEKNQTAISFFFQKKEEVNIEEYRDWIAKQCANEISYWLTCSKKGEAIISDGSQERILTEKDIVILVRNRTEAQIIKESLKKVNILSKYSSPYESVFKTFDALELLSILKSILDPTDINLLKKSILTHILNKIAFQKIKENSKTKISHFLIQKLYEYNDKWKTIGIFYTIKTMILEYQKYANNFEMYKNQQRNINFLHIAELLQEKSQNCYKENSLMRWFEKKILEKNNISENEYIKNFAESKIIRIITIHKSKGLEYPIVWIPFIVDFNVSKSYFYHEKKTLKIFFDNNKSSETLKKSDEERLAEDLRFLYVALTRSIYHCSIGISYLVKKRKKNKKSSDIHKSSLGYIIQNGKCMNYKELLYELKILNKKLYIEVKYQAMNCKSLTIKKDDLYILSQPQFLLKEIKLYSQITSFTKIKQENKHFNNIQYNNIESYFFKEKDKKKTIHNFPHGNKAGIFIHYILKTIKFNNTFNIDWFYTILKKYEFSEKWAKTLMFWINNILNFKINNLNITLSSLKKTQYIKELEFFLPIKNTLYCEDLNQIIQSIDLISSISQKIFFNPVIGILKGFIDLVFIFNKKYYILDYKCNYLGNNDNCYSSKNIKKEIIKNRYDIQYQLYTLALHQYLKKKVKQYHYKTHFGGVFYLFLRGINVKDSIFYILPDYLLIKKLTKLILQKK
ncbi:exodeoxyribonuclease V subunit beta [Buchnera aphidicola]|uniref:RecBCD enzyme subunit RecB n=1 Tax=Buchnera aphidicola subsp. Schizaphis graminum (strain Sg) TaxID=198804 RepID=RECB_BUCAP|nr:exodeoxyribonuclease V subunit beta [Buchnera aphidicola]Q8K9A9.1 RecName: Full=RecBCD enzyme subunit RecB; AltName: Full=Exonuclease V subunit RecB; Short=ExoV subunit RecB; AltName: Full=Helicase/nuclease RecBCD subunit RecB [Buchnera aphidicola str. Sg (Schizaphis graminum)]AAM67982.1 exodeoxyribonuclease V 135 kD polypeptide [Buchnera aphidicola str. Sg (Schizaphis graminum)]AWI49525.1 exodeoxyribonuclease V subunit beta [Buchnera aphidicola (Schizaphis graminum)]